jgi:hypothetical protein
VKNSIEISNPGSALGEAIGALLEKEIHRILEPLAQKRGCIYVATGPSDPRTGKSTKLILADSDGNEYNVDSVIINNRFQPLVLVESKYIRYKKHNRDKASWICTAHTKLRQKYVTVRKSIAVLMGSWSAPSKRFLQSFEVELFEVSLQQISDVLEEYGIDYAWAEKDRKKAMESWRIFTRLSPGDREKIAKKLIGGIRKQLSQSLQSALDESIPRRIRSIAVIVRSNRGETFTYTFPDLKRALEFMQVFDEERDMATTSAPSLLMEPKAKASKFLPNDRTN